MMGGIEMDTAIIFAVLGIEETKDEEQIRNAYLEKLKENNPEDNPEGFQRLREAYEQALFYTRQSEEGDSDTIDDTPTGHWTQKVKDIYFHLSRRLKDEEWKELLKDDICLDLEYGEEIKWKLFDFLKDHYQLNSSTYRILGEFFGIYEQQEEWKEHLPTAFVDYMLRRMGDTEGSEDFPYQWIEGEDTADYDQFQNRLYELEELLAEKKEKEAEDVVTVMEQLHIDHPYYRLAKARLKVRQGEKTVAEIAEELLKNYPESPKIQILAAEVLWNCDRKEEAVAAFQRIEEQFGEYYYIVEKCLAFYNREQGNLAEALKHCLRALQNAEDENLEEMRKKMDEECIEMYQEKLIEKTLTTEDAVQLCSSYLRLGKNQEGIDFMLAYPEFTKEMKNGHKLFSILYYNAKQHEESIKEDRLWQEVLQERIAKLDEAVDEPNEEKKAEYKLDLAMAYSYEGKSFQELGEKEKEKEKKKELFQKAEVAFQKAMDYAPDSPEIQQYLLDLLIEKEDYEEAIKLADKILSFDSGWFPAVVQKQKACYELGQAQEVVDLFYEAKRIFAGYPPMYERIAQVFIDYRQYQDAEEIFAQAEEANVESFKLDVVKLSCERMQCKSDVDYYEAIKKAEELVKKFKEGNAENKVLAELYYNMAIIEDCQYYYEFQHPGKAEEYIKEAIRLKEDDVYYYFTYGYILQDAGKFQEAIEQYQIFLSDNPMTENTAMNLGCCYDKVGEWEKAIEYYEKAVAINPKQREANRRIFSIYKREGKKRDSVPLLLRALPYGEKQLAICPDNAYDYRERAIVYGRIGMLEEALKSVEKSLAIEKNNPYGLNLKGWILSYKGKYQQAIFYQKKAFHNLSNQKEDGIAMLCNIAGNCHRIGDFEQEEKWYRNGIKLFEGKDQERCYFKLITLFKSQKRFDKAIHLLQESFEKELISKECYLLRYFEIRRGILRCMKQSEQLEEAKKLEQEAFAAAREYDSIAMWEEVSDIQLYHLFDFESALANKKMVMERVEKEEQDWWDHTGKLLERMELYWELQDKEEVEKWSELYRKTIEEHFCYDTDRFPAIEQFLTDPDSAYINYCNMVHYWIFTGQMELAKDGVKKVRSLQPCRDCNLIDCAAVEQLLAFYYEATGELKKAYQCFQKVSKEYPLLEWPYLKLYLIGKRLEEM